MCIRDGCALLLPAGGLHTQIEAARGDHLLISDGPFIDGLLLELLVRDDLMGKIAMDETDVRLQNKSPLLKVPVKSWTPVEQPCTNSYPKNSIDL